MAIGGVLFDIDGVLVTSWQPIAGARETLHALAVNQVARAYLTNTTTRTRVQIADLLTEAGMDVTPDEVIRPARAGRRQPSGILVDHLRPEHRTEVPVLADLL